MAIQLSQARASLENYKKDITDVSQQVFVEWCNFIARFVYRKLRDKDPERFIKSTTISVVSGTEAYALPNDFRDMAIFGCGIFTVDGSGNDTNNQLARTGFGNPVRGFYISGSNIILTPKPAKAETLKLRYIPKITAFTSQSDYFTTDTTQSGSEVIPDEYLDFLVADLAKLHAMWDEDLGLESYEDSRFVRHLDEFLDTVKREADVYFLPDFSQNY